MNFIGKWLFFISGAILILISIFISIFIRFDLDTLLMAALGLSFLYISSLVGKNDGDEGKEGNDKKEGETQGKRP